MFFDPACQFGKALIVDQALRVGGGKFFLCQGDAQPQTGRPAAIAHALAQVEKLDLTDRYVALADQVIKIIADRYGFLGLGRQDQHHLTVFRQAQKL